MATETNPLGSFVTAFQNARRGAQQYEQQQVANQLTEQLRQVQLLTAQRQLAEANKSPQQKLADQIQEAFAVDALKRGALVQTPVGLEGESIALPSAINQTANQLEAAGVVPTSIPQQPLSIALGQPTGLNNALTGLSLQSGVQQPIQLSDALSQIVTPTAQQPVSFQVPSAPMRGFEEPTAIPGFNVSEEAARQTAARRLAEQTSLINARQQGLGEKLQYIMTDQGLVAVPTVVPKGSVAPSEVAPITTTGGEALTRTPKSGSARGLTPNAQAAILGKAGTAGITKEEIDSKYTQDGVTDFNRLIIDSNKKISEDKSLMAQEKLKQIPAAERAKANGFIAAHKGLTRLTEEVNKFKIQGKEPGVWERAVGTALEAPPDGIFSALYQSALGQNLTGDEQTLNSLRAMVRSAVTKANAGLSQTEREIANVSQYVPKTNDSIEETLRKGALLETYLIDQVESITTDPKDWLKSLNEAKTVNSPATGAPSTAGATKVGRFTVTPK